jgi:chemotaxis protein MotB
LNKVQEELEKVLAPEIRNHMVDVKAKREGLIVSLREMGFFVSGSASLQPGSRDAIDRLAAILKERPEALRIEGHSDDVPIHNERFESNWELSTMRATDLVKVLITRYGLDPSRLSAAGYAEFHPVALNDSAEGRARNRRVDIVILNANPTPQEFLPAKPTVVPNQDRMQRGRQQ